MDSSIATTDKDLKTALHFMISIATILEEMRIGNIKLITNNPSKISSMEKYNITVSERIPLVVGQNETNLSYLKTKVSKSGHLMWKT